MVIGIISVVATTAYLVVSRSEINLNSREFYIRLNDSHGKEKWAYYKSWDGYHD